MPQRNAPGEGARRGLYEGFLRVTRLLQPQDNVYQILTIKSREKLRVLTILDLKLLTFLRSVLVLRSFPKLFSFFDFVNTINEIGDFRMVSGARKRSSVSFCANTGRSCVALVGVAYVWGNGVAG